MAWIAALLLFTGLTGYVLYAAHLVSSRMSELKWELPSRIYAAPLLVYPGSRLAEKDLRAYLERLGFRESGARLPEAGQWARKGGGYRIHRRKFTDAVGDHPAGIVDLAVTGGRVDSVRVTGASGAVLEESAVALEPPLVGRIFPARRAERTIVRLSDLPPTMRDAILTMEDSGFYAHRGVSLRGLARAAWRNLRGGKVAEGGSTLTQQLMKNFFLTPERTLRRKAAELVFTLVAEALYTKDEIFEAYVNEIYLGQRHSASIHGFGEAARFYFAKEVRDLTLAEQALLVSLIRAPGRFSPYEHPERAKKQRRAVLERMAAKKKITAAQFELAQREPLEPRGKTPEEQTAPHFIDFLRSELAERVPPGELQSEGYAIYSSLDLFLQAAASRAVAAGLKALANHPKLKKGNQPLEAALLAIQPQTGAVKAMVGGRDYGLSQFNRAAQARRQLGSVVKPFVAAVALSPGGGGEPPAATPATLLEDEPATFSFAGREWTPRNYENVYLHRATLRTALERSLNVATVNLAALVGLERISRGLEAFGFQSFSAVPAVTLGALEATLPELAAAYSVFANGGLLARPHGASVVVSGRKERVEQRSMEVRNVLDPGVAFLVTNLLRGALERGTARAAERSGLAGALAGKTGTTQEYRDSWFVGYSPNLLAVVWVGYDREAPTGLSGAAGALPIWIRFMREALAYLPSEEFPEPEGISWREIERARGCEGGAGEQLREAFLEGTKPPRCEADSLAP